MDNVCRICLSHDNLCSIFNEMETVMHSYKIMSIANVKIYPNDGLPSCICDDCLATLNKCMNFVQLCEKSDLKLRKSLQKRHSHGTEYILDNPSHVDDDVKSQYTSGNPNNRDDDIKSIYILGNPSSHSDKDIKSTVEREKREDLSHKTKKKDPYKSSMQITHAKHKFQCITCGRVLSSRFRLQSHMRTHTGERPFSCTHCGKLFSLLENLKVHIRTHTGEKPHKCSECGATFAHQPSLAVHKRKHTGEEPYKCHMCPRSFANTASYQHHIRLHTGEKKYECDICHRAFTAKRDLARHIMTHTSQKPYICCICGIGLSRSTHLKRHMKTVHRNNTSHAKKCRKENVEDHEQLDEDDIPLVTNYLQIIYK